MGERVARHSAVAGLRTFANSIARQGNAAKQNLMSEMVLAADLGGTNIRMAAVGRDGSLLNLLKSSTPRSRTAIADEIVRLARQCRDSVKDGQTASSLGLAVPALLDAGSGTIVYAPNLLYLNGFDLASGVARELNMAVKIENDATAATIGEHWLGASKGFSSSICVTLGTGVGGGLIIDGRPLKGIDGMAGEIGHICVEPNGVPCGCGSHGCLEQYSSASAVVRMTKELLAEYPETSLSGIQNLESHIVFSAGCAGDPLAIEVFRRVGFYLGLALAGLVNVLNPEVIVIGGGAAAGWELFIGEMRAQIALRAFQRPAERVNIFRALLGDSAGIMGAARIALETDRA